MILKKYVKYLQWKVHWEPGDKIMVVIRRIGTCKGVRFFHYYFIYAINLREYITTY
jgi:hypothetical protein